MHVKRSPVSLFPIELRDGAIPVGIEPHFNESEPFWLTALTIVNDGHSPNGPVRLEPRSNVGFSGLEGQVPHKDIFHFDVLSTCDRKSGQDRTRAVENRANAKMPQLLSVLTVARNLLEWKSDGSAKPCR